MRFPWPRIALELVGAAGGLVAAATIHPLPEVLRVGLGAMGIALAVHVINMVQLWRLATRAGPVAVTQFAGTTGKTAPTDQLGARFQERLGRAHTSAPGPVPASGSFDDAPVTVAPAPAESSHWAVEIAAASLRSLAPRQAYLARLRALERDDDPRCGIAVQVETLLDNSTGQTTIWRDSWERAVDEAAYWVAAYVLPRTRACRHAPWAAWQGLDLPDAALGAYVEAGEHLAEKRYDAAMARLRDAARADPMNLDIRLEIAQLEERLELWVDALETYVGIIDLARDWHPSVPGWLASRRVHRFWVRAELIARYRLAILMGVGENVAHQWFKKAPSGPAGPTRRDSQRDRIRCRLSQRVDELLAEPEGTPASAIEDETELIESFQRAGLRTWEALDRDARRCRRAKPGFSRRSIRLGLFWAECQIKRTQARAGKGEWQLEAADLEREMSDRALRGRPRGSRARRPGRGWALRLGAPTFPDHYNRACTYALAAMPPETRRDRESGSQPARRDDHEALVEGAVASLERAAACVRGVDLLRRREWILREDPDLASIRTEPRFARFAATYFGVAIHGDTASDTHRAEVPAYVAKLVERTARMLARTWHEELTGANGDLAWRLQRDREELRLVANLASERRDWHTRLAFLEEMRRRAADYGVELTAIPVPVGYEEPLASVDAIIERLDALPAKVEAWEKAHSARTHPARVPQKRARQLCQARRDSWERLADWYAAPPEEEADVPCKEAFARALEAPKPRLRSKVGAGVRSVAPGRAS